MKAIEVINKMLTADLRNTCTAVVTTYENPIQDLACTIGDFRTSSRLNPHTSYLVVWEELDEAPRIGQPDAIIIPDNRPLTDYICLYVIE